MPTSIRFIFIIFMFCSFNSFAQTFETTLRKAYAILTIAQERDRQAAEKLDDAKTKRIRAEEDLVDALESNQLPKKEKAKKEANIKILKKQESEVVKQRKEAADYLAQVLIAVKTDDKKRKKFVAEYEKKNGKLPDEVPQPTLDTDPVIGNTPTNTTPTTEPTSKPSAENVVTAPPKPIKKEKKEPKKEPKKPSKKDNKVLTANGLKQITPYDPQKDVALNPPQDICELAFDGVDNFTQKRKRETKSHILFKHTEDFMRAAMGDKDYITCQISASRIQGSYYFINLTFQIQSKEAQKAFGFIDKGTPIVFKLINGRNLTFYTSKTDIGILENGITTYKAQLQLASSDAKLLSTVELDVLRVAWSAGYEDYEIYHMDMLQNIFKCLDSEVK